MSGALSPFSVRRTGRMITGFRTRVISCQVLIPNKKCPRTRAVFLHEGLNLDTSWYCRVFFFNLFSGSSFRGRSGRHTFQLCDSTKGLMTRPSGTVVVQEACVPTFYPIHLVLLFFCQFCRSWFSYTPPSGTYFPPVHYLLQQPTLEVHQISLAPFFSLPIISYHVFFGNSYFYRPPPQPGRPETCPYQSWKFASWNLRASTCDF